jgi:hypothetical protein
MATIQELVERRRELVARLAEVDAEIRSRHGEDRQAKQPVKKAAAKRSGK